MIRRDYLLRMIQELTQALARILFLKRAGEYSKALDEIQRILTRFWNLTPDQIQGFSLQQWIEQCRQEEGPMGEKLIALAHLFNEQAELHARAENEPQRQRSLALALGLYLEAVTHHGTIISVDLLGKIKRLVKLTAGERLPAEVLKRLLSYYESRGRLDKAEDALFDWLETRDPNAPEGGLAFYQRAAAKSDHELEQSGLPRDEVEQGRLEWLELMEKSARS
jgi:uncharacterized protein DUF6483